MSKEFLITQTLLSQWEYVYKTEDGYENFLCTLERNAVVANKAMLDGIKFENKLNAVLDGASIEEADEWFKPIRSLSRLLDGSQKQVKLSKHTTIDGTNFVLYGILDFLKKGVIYDTKFSKTYRRGKYLHSPQHPMYFALVPEAYEFSYLICDGRWLYKETYRPEDCQPIEREIEQFMRFLEDNKLVSLYMEKWVSKY